MSRRRLAISTATFRALTLARKESNTEMLKAECAGGTEQNSRCLELKWPQPHDSGWPPFVSSAEDDDEA